MERALYTGLDTIVCPPLLNRLVTDGTAVPVLCRAEQSAVLITHLFQLAPQL